MSISHIIPSQFPRRAHVMYRVQIHACVCSPGPSHQVPPAFQVCHWCETGASLSLSILLCAMRLFTAP